MSRSTPKIGLALGGGGARGLAHVHVLGALDDLGLVPTAIAGTSIGAIIGAGRAAGHDGAAVKEMITAAFRNRGEVWGKLWKLRPKNIADLFGNGLTQFDAELVLDLFVPDAIPASFDDLQLPLAIVATDFYGCAERVLTTGELRRAVAASIALPIVFRPVIIDDVVLIDGGVVNPVPYDRMPAPVDLVVAVDVIGEPVRPATRAHPNATESVFGASQILMQSVFAEKARQRQPDVIIKPPVDHFAVLDFLKAAAIIRSTHDVRDHVKRELDAAIEAYIRGPIDAD